LNECDLTFLLRLHGTLFCQPSPLQRTMTPLCDRLDHYSIILIRQLLEGDVLSEKSPIDQAQSGAPLRLMEGYKR
jgi:hypothetical protein